MEENKTGRIWEGDLTLSVERVYGSCGTPLSVTKLAGLVLITQGGNTYRTVMLIEISNPQMAVKRHFPLGYAKLPCDAPVLS